MRRIALVSQSLLTSASWAHAFKKATEVLWLLAASPLQISFVRPEVESLMRCQNHNRLKKWNRTLLFQIRCCTVQTISLVQQKTPQTLQLCILLAMPRRICQVRTVMATGLM